MENRIRVGLFVLIPFIFLLPSSRACSAPLIDCFSALLNCWEHGFVSDRGLFVTHDHALVCFSNYISGLDDDGLCYFQGFTKSLAMTVLSEIGDKTFFAAAVNPFALLFCCDF